MERDEGEEGEEGEEGDGDWVGEREGENDSCGDQDISPSHFHTWKSSP